MGFEEDMDRRISSTASERSAQTSAAVSLENRLLEELSKFKREFADAADYLRKRGVQDRRVVYIDRNPPRVYTNPLLILGEKPPTDLTVYPFTALPIGGIFLHEGHFYGGQFELSRFRSVLKGLRKGDPVVNASGPRLVPCDNAFKFGPRRRYGGGGDYFWYVRGGESSDDPDCVEPREWLLGATEKALEVHAQR